ncbi:MAG TPA: tetratricopeptide repeat protein, partial [Gemmatimonadota bacterium]|nr:tetratricopeptide repeat protein [Gemmatimonadota bacterium]
MKIRTVQLHVLSLAVFLLSAFFVACSETRDAQAGADEGSTAVAANEIPITTSSEEARELFLEGRAMSENLRALDARPILQQAVEKDPKFAYAYLLLANTAPSPEEFFSNLELAVANMANASEGERILIQVAQAGVDGDGDRQLALLRELVEKYPDDVRAHNALAGQLAFARQEWDAGIAEYRKAVEIDPTFSQAWNNMGYAARAAGRFDEAEQAFRKYIEVLPSEPNPYDSYAEFLMKMGRFDESIVQYRKALEADSTFNASYIGIAHNHMFLGQGDEARATMDEMFAKAPNDGVRTNALLWKAAAWLHEGNEAQAFRVLEERRDISVKKSDWTTLSGDDVLIGQTMLDLGVVDGAVERFARSVEEIEKADVPEGIKEATRRNQIYNEARVALASNDLAKAKERASAYHTAVQEPAVPFELRQDHELMGRIALAEGKGAEAVAHFEQANNQDPRILLLTAQAHRAAGNDQAANDLIRQVADYNQLSFPLSYVRNEA